MSRPPRLCERLDALLARLLEMPEKGQVHWQVGPRADMRILSEERRDAGAGKRVVERRGLFEIRWSPCDIAAGEQADAHAIVCPCLADGIVPVLREAQQI